jgi:hypothetical protein
MDLLGILREMGRMEDFLWKGESEVEGKKISTWKGSQFPCKEEVWKRETIYFE